MTVATKTRITPNDAAFDEQLQARIWKLLRTEIDFIPNPEFQTEGGLAELALSDILPAENDQPRAPADLPAHLARLCEVRLLSPEDERELFRQMNYLKFRANAMRSRLNPKASDFEAVNRIEDLLSRAQAIRDHLIKANMRLVMSIVKKFVTPQQSFDDMLSDGTFSLMQAVDKFDYSRGFRFSTYAYRAVARNAYRAVTSAQRDNSRFTREAEEWAFEDTSGAGASSLNEHIWTNLRELLSMMMHELDRREQFIIRSRYALGAHRKVRTFQCLADKLGVSKERVRQLEQRAVAKLQSLAAEVDLDELRGSALV